MPLDLSELVVSSVYGDGFEEAILDTIGGEVVEVLIAMPGPMGPRASQEVLPGYGGYPEQTVAGRLNDLVDRKAERADIGTPADLALLYSIAKL